MAGKNGFAALVKQRTEGSTKRRKLDDYETPEAITRYLLQRVGFRGPILEPAAGSGRMVRVLREAMKCCAANAPDRHSPRVVADDIKDGGDFLKRATKWAGDIVTNPPYRDGLAERFVRHALKLADGRVCMLMQSGFIWGDRRANGLYAESKPDVVIVVPERIRFYVNNKPIDSQFFNHAWLCWPDRKTRYQAVGYSTVVHWASAEEDFES